MFKSLLAGIALLPSGAVASDFEYEEIYCLAQNVYFEARGESLAGQYAVSDVVLNRVQSTHYPNTVCEVVKDAKTWKGKIIRNKCQFSWYCDGKSDEPTNTDSWHRAVDVAIGIYQNDKYRGLTEGSTHYHTQYVNPSWNKSMDLVGSIGDHIFYRMKR
jgi:spore germination cell wall hydrolase CwlJ-like protein